jgi:hypothetical protein
MLELLKAEGGWYIFNPFTDYNFIKYDKKFYLYASMIANHISFSLNPTENCSAVSKIKNLRLILSTHKY